MPKYKVLSIERELRRVEHEVDAATPEEAEQKVKEGHADAVYVGSEYEETLEWVRTQSVTEVKPWVPSHNFPSQSSSGRDWAF